MVRWAAPSPTGVSLPQANFHPTLEGPMMWYITGIALAAIVAAGYILSRRPAQRTTIVLERD